MTSVLTFILLVVLGGGVGLLVVSLAESSKPTADEPRPGRAEPDAPAEPEHPGRGDQVVGPGGADGAHDAGAEPEPAWALVAAGVPGAAEPEPPRRRRTSEPVPRSQIAVEGRFVDVAGVPVWRRFTAIVGIVSITVLGGVVIAAVLAAAIGAAAELLNTAIG